MGANMADLAKVIVFSIFLGMILSGCTLSIMLTDSHGRDNDVDSAPVNETKTDADLSIPTALT